jgi:hypothetical protein
MDALGLLVAFGSAALLGGIIGGGIGMMAAVELIRFGDSKRRVRIEVEAEPVTARVTAPAVVNVPVTLHIPPIEPLTVPIVMAAQPSARELAERILAAVPDMGPTSLAEIVGCSKSTAHAIIQEWRAAHGTPDVDVPEREELGAWPRPPMPKELTG